MTYPIISTDAVGWITEAEMVEVDRVMIEDLGIELLQMMENAGRSLARVAIEEFDPSSVWIAAGSGGNGGGGLVAARHLANAGIEVKVTTTRPVGEFTGVPAHQLRILDRMGVPVGEDVAVGADLSIDAVIGYSLRGAPRGRVEELIEAMADRDTVLSLDSPSGLDVTTGAATGVVVRADITMTIALPKIGLRSTPAVGRLLLADISVPRAVTRRFGPAPEFRVSPIVEIREAVSA